MSRSLAAHRALRGGLLLRRLLLEPQCTGQADDMPTGRRSDELRLALGQAAGSHSGFSLPQKVLFMYILVETTKCHALVLDAGSSNLFAKACFSCLEQEKMRWKY